jgi:hypothetical protein
MDVKNHKVKRLKNSKILSFGLSLTHFLIPRTVKGIVQKGALALPNRLRGFVGERLSTPNGDLGVGGSASGWTAFFNNPLFPMGFAVALLGVGGWGGPTHGLLELSDDRRQSVPQQVSENKPKDLGTAGEPFGGDRRGQHTLTLFALVPHHLGLTIQEQPRLYWYLSKPVSYPVHLTVTVHDETQGEPILETVLTVIPKEGIHSVSLQDFNIRLDLEREYRWCVKLAADTENPSRNVMAEGRIVRTVPHETLLQQLRNAEPEQVTAIYSEAGFWYDALATISDFKGSTLKDKGAPKGENQLMEQVDLMEVAKAEENITLTKHSH